MKKNFIIVFLLAGLSVNLSGCIDEFLKPEPKSEITEQQFFGEQTTEVAIERFINNIYHSRVWTIWDRRWPWFAEVPADGFRHTLEFDIEGQEYDNHNFRAGQFNIFRNWNYIWWPIGQANVFLDKYDELEENHGDEWTKLEWFKGQALFLRAYNYFVGVQMWGPIPLVTTPAEGESHGNSTVPQIYEQIIADLEQIVDNNLCPEWPNLPERDMGRITMGAAKSLLAKVYLTRSYTDAAQAGDVAEAIHYAGDIVNNSSYGLFDEPIMDNGDTLFTAYESAFLPINKNGIEGIWEYQFEFESTSAKFPEEWVPPGYYGSWGTGRFHATPQLYESFEPGDRRKESYITGVVVSPATGEMVDAGDKVYMTKFHDPNYEHGVRQMDINFPKIRFADILLIYAEALNKENNGPTPGAFEAVNRVRNRAGLPDLSGNYDYNSFFEEIQEERLKELAGESQRLFDLRRWGYNTLKQKVEAANPNASVEPHEIYWPIPSAELEVNPLINQNDGY